LAFEVNNDDAKAGEGIGGSSERLADNSFAENGRVKFILVDANCFFDKPVGRLPGLLNENASGSKEQDAGCQDYPVLRPHMAFTIAQASCCYTDRGGI
jgi:hypothetical protein